jgi:hypothetical protein
MGMGGCERKRSTIRVMAFAFGQVAHCSNKSGALPGNCETGVPSENVIRKLGSAQIPCSCVEIPCSFKKFPVLLHREILREAIGFARVLALKFVAERRILQNSLLISL